METIEKQLERITKADDGKPRKTVIIIGSGVAGLAAAFELLKLGLGGHMKSGHVWSLENRP